VLEAPAYLKRTYIYVRQSTLIQTVRNTESLLRQYGLAGRARELGWAEHQIVVADDDLGRSGASAQGRKGFSGLVAEVGLGKAGIVLSLESSRLARNHSDWYRPLDLCALTDTLIADADGVYHPAGYNDRLVLGLKGTLPECELHLLRSRMTEGLRAKAARGELRLTLPAGLDYDERRAGKPAGGTDPRGRPGRQARGGRPATSGQTAQNEALMADLHIGA